MFGHTGGSPGVGTEIEVLPAQGLVMVVLGNSDPDAVFPAVEPGEEGFRIR